MHARHALRSPLADAGRPAWFVAVGCGAALVHWAVVVALVEGGGCRPLLANVGGWLVAFVVSFIGHHRLSFKGHGLPVLTTVRRFFTVSAGGFAVNEALYALLLGWSGPRYGLALAMALGASAAITYLLSRHWAFRHKPGP